jgi:excisionase family DNA binding protein
MVTSEAKTQTVEEAAKELGIGRNQAYAAARRGEIPTIRIGTSAFWCCESPLKRCSLAGQLNGENARMAHDSRGAKTSPASI